MLKDYIEEKRYRDEFSINSPDDGAPNELLGHFEILVDAGILKHCEIQRDENGKFVYWDLRGIFITMQGHDLLDALRDQNVWDRIKGRAKKAGVSLSWEFIKASIPVVIGEIVKGAS